MDWLDFEDEFQKDFTPLNAEALAVNTLETTSYFQGHQSVNDYLDQFQDLIYDSGYTNPKTIVVKFRWGLDWHIALAIGAMATRRPSNTDSEGWFELAVQLDQNQATDEAFQASYRLGPTPTTHSNPWPRLLALPKSTLTLPPSWFAHSNQPLVTQSQWTLMQPARSNQPLTLVADVEKLDTGQRIVTYSLMSATWPWTNWNWWWTTALLH